MTEEIGVLWEKGEVQLRSGQSLDALLSFQRAKALLLAESNSVYANSTTYVFIMQVMELLLLYCVMNSSVYDKFISESSVSESSLLSR